MPFGAFIEFMPGKQGLLHISEVSWKRLDSLEGVLKEGDKVKIQLVGTDPKTGKLRLSRKVLMPKPEGYVEPEKRERREGGNDRGSDRNRSGSGNDRRGGGDRNRGDRGDRPQRNNDGNRNENAAPVEQAPQAPQDNSGDDSDLAL
jgi:polyribonucleotide nucleotidyltransferase